MKNVLVIEAEQALRSRVAPGLKEQGWSVLDANDHDHALALARQHHPELILCDWQAPWCDIGRSCRSLPTQNGTSHPRPILIAAGNGQVAEKVAALESGADEYVAKSVDFRALGELLARLTVNGHGSTAQKSNGARHGASETRLKFWGVRGSIASPGPETVKYGGNTSCVEVRAGGEIIILDAGTGIRKLGLALTEEFQDRPIDLNLLITHTHWDHIQGFPFFPPAYDSKNEVTIYGFEGARLGLQNTLSSQMESPYFPISMRQMPGHLAVRELKEMSFRVGAIGVKAHFLNHPGLSVGYRLFTPGGSISYLPDVELFQRLRTRWKNGSAPARREEFSTVPKEDQSALEFVRGSEVLILDSQYDAIEYDQHIGWGHSCFEDTVTFAMQAGVRRLFMFHHDPSHADEKISNMVAQAREMTRRAHSPLIIEAAREGCEVTLPHIIAS
jgi:phosphoribosyl 1,2-cyclic phosphodiesterase/ActR/RegA family two-component response regulator